MAWALAVAVGLLGGLSLVSGGTAVMVASALRRAFEAALADESDDGLRARGVLLVERVRSPLLRWAINRRSRAIAGMVVAGVVRDRIAALHRGGLVALATGVAAIAIAAFVPGMMS